MKNISTNFFGTAILCFLITVSFLEKTDVQRPCKSSSTTEHHTVVVDASQVCLVQHIVELEIDVDKTYTSLIITDILAQNTFQLLDDVIAVLDNDKKYLLLNLSHLTPGPYIIVLYNNDSIVRTYKTNATSA